MLCSVMWVQRARLQGLPCRPPGGGQGGRTQALDGGRLLDPLGLRNCCVHLLHLGPGLGRVGIGMARHLLIRARKCGLFGATGHRVRYSTGCDLSLVPRSSSCTDFQGDVEGPGAAWLLLVVSPTTPCKALNKTQTGLVYSNPTSKKARAQKPLAGDGQPVLATF